MNTDTTTTETTTTNAAPGWTGRADYAERREARIERLQERADRHEAAAHDAFRRAHEAVAGIPFGQPNIRGCLTPALNRQERAMRAGIRESDAAEEARARAEAAANNHAISSDDPAALDKLRAKLAKLERMQARMKEANAAIRLRDTAAGDAKLAAMGYTPEDVAQLRAPDFCGRVGFPSYAITNNGAEIRRCKERIAQLERLASAPAPEGWAFDGGEVVCNVSENRVQVRFDEIPDEETRGRLKRFGFRWCRWAGVWQRQLTPRAVDDARYICPAAPAVAAACGA